MASRAALRASVTKLLARVDQLVSKGPPTVEDYEETEEECLKCLRQAEKYEALLTAADTAALKAITDVDEELAEMDDCSAYDDKISAIKIRCASLQEKCKQFHSGQAGPSATTESACSVQIPPQPPKLALPTIRIPRFGGKLTDFYPFWEQFNLAVHDESSIPDVHKMQYLIDALHHEAREAVRNIPITAQGYATAREVLVARFGDKELVVIHLFTELLDLPKVIKEDDTEKLLGLFDAVSNHVLTLRSLGFAETHFVGLLYPVLLRLLPDRMVYEFLQGRKSKITTADDPSLDETVTLDSDKLVTFFVERYLELMRFLRHQTQTRQSQLAILKGTAKSPSGSYSGRPPMPARSQCNPPPPARPIGPQRNGKVFGALQGGSTEDFNSSQMATRPGGNRDPNSRHPPRQQIGSRVQSHCYATAAKKSSCPNCNLQHSLLHCESFLQLPIERRLETVKREGLCYNCLARKHTRWCGKRNCPECNAKHNELLCAEPKSKSTGSFATAQVGPQAGLLPCCTLKVSSPTSEVVVRCMLDTGSQHTYISQKLAAKLKLKPIRSEELYLMVFQGGRPLKPARFPVVEFKLQLPSREMKLTALVTPWILGGVLERPTEELVAQLTAKGVSPLADDPRVAADVEILLGAVDALPLLATKRLERHGPFWTLKSDVGYMVVSAPSPSTSASSSVVFLASQDAENFQRLWNLEAVGVSDQELTKTNDVPDSFDRRLRRLSNGSYQISLNWKEDRKTALRDNQRVALAQMKALNRKFMKDPKFFEVYAEQIQVFFDNGFAEPLGQNFPRYVLPHFPVIREDKLSYKCRPVFNGSSREKRELSLNDCIDPGPNLLPAIFNVLVRFRTFAIALTGDITKAFLMISMDPADRPYLSFLWLKRPVTSFEEALPQLQKSAFAFYQMASMTFGICDSPYNLIQTIKSHAKLYEQSHPEACRAITEGLYMDDLLFGADSIEDVRTLQHAIKKIFSEAGMKMCKWSTNVPALTAEFGDALNQEVTISDSTSPQLKVLGLAWKPTQDCFGFKPASLQEFVHSSPPNLRTLLGAAARLFDPLGLLAAYTGKLRILIQDVQVRKLPFDAPLPLELASRWIRWGADLDILESFVVPRYMGHPQVTSQELHCFTDASARLYATVIYLKSVTPSEVRVELVAAKSKVFPVNSNLSMPRKELVAAVLGVRLCKAVAGNVGKVDAVHFWTDATVVLHWIHAANDHRWTVFVTNRLRDITTASSPSSWHHIPGSQNPADLPSRGCSATELCQNNLWKSGPPVLYELKDYPAFAATSELSLDERHAVATVTVPSPPPSQWFDLSRYSSSARAIRVFARVRRCADRFLHRSTTDGPAYLVAGELQAARMELIKMCQSSLFPEEIDCLRRNQCLSPASKLRAFSPFLDAVGVLRINSRLSASNEPTALQNPILLADASLTRLFILECHNNVLHMKTDACMSRLRSTFWILRCRQLIKKVLRSCPVCRKDYAQRLDPAEGDLPLHRVEPTLVPFQACGVDYAGPISCLLEGRMPELTKVWLLIFTCSITRAVHLEVVNSLSTNDFLLAFRRFVASRGVPVKIISDNGLSFVSANKVLASLFKSLSSRAAQQLLGTLNIEWDFIPPRAPWWGGMYERQIRTLKSCLRKTLGLRQVPLVLFTTIIKEIEYVINERPLAYVNSETDFPRPLRPLDFLLPTAHLPIPQGSLYVRDFPADKDFTRAWNIRETLLKDFWKRWRAEYLLQLRSAHQKKKGKPLSLSVGDLVLFDESPVPRQYWKVGRVVKLYPGPDGVVRRYRVRFGSREMDRAAKMLWKLPASSS